MARVFLSFLGTNRYIDCNYVYGDKKVPNSRYIQQALMELFCPDFKKGDRVRIFVTERARQENWEGEGRLLDVLKSKFPGMDYQAVSIPEGLSEDEIWGIFDGLYKAIGDSDSLVMDITHAFRSIPALALVFVNYARFLKNIRVEGIYYGAFEKLGPARAVENMPLEDRNAPVLNLLSLEKVLQWSMAADDFVTTGQTARLARHIKRDMDLSKSADADDFKKLCDGLNYVSGLFSTCRGGEIIDGSKIVDAVSLIGAARSKSPSVLGPILDKVSEKLSVYKKDSLENGLMAVEWCMDNDLVQQGITILDEFLVTLLLKRQGADYRNLKNRQTASSALVYHGINNKGSFNLRDNIDKSLFQELEKDSQVEALGKLKVETARIRNDINHGGFEAQAAGPANFKIRLGDCLERLRVIMKNPAMAMGVKGGGTMSLGEIIALKGGKL